MRKKEINILQDRVEQDFLPFVRQPGRYIGGEVNQVKKDLSACDVTVALCFPDVYEIAMSHTGIAIIYNIINSMSDAAAERVFAPWFDAEDILRKESIPLYSLESKAAVKDFDIVAFSLNSELCYTNVLNMLDLSGLPVRSADRSDDDPLVVAGGVSANCAEPMADFRRFETCGKIIYSKELTFRGGTHGDTLRIIPETKMREMSKDLPRLTGKHSSHHENFLLAVKGQEKTRSPFCVAGPLTQVFLLGVISQRLNATFHFDRKTKQITDNKAANQLLIGPPPRKAWQQYYKL